MAADFISMSSTFVAAADKTSTTIVASASATLAPTDPSPGVPGHSYLWFFLVILLELSIIAGLVYATYFTVSKRSGLNEPEKVRRIWARAPEIRLQPVMRPLVFATAVGYGAQGTINSFFNGLLALVGISQVGTFVNVLIGLVALSYPSKLCIMIYKATGGTKWIVCAACKILADWFMNGFLLILFTEFNDVVGKFVFSISIFVCYVVFQAPFLYWGHCTDTPSAARIIYNSSVVPEWVKLDRTILVASPPLIILYLISHFIEASLKIESYLAFLTIRLGNLILLASCALAAIISVNRALLANEFQWQWRAFLTPAIPMGSVNTLMAIIALLQGKNFFQCVYVTIHFFLTCGSCGVLGAYAYMILAEAYARKYLDEDAFAQDDLLAEFEDDEDNEELEV